MSQFKYKPDKIKYSDQVTTLDETHRKIIGGFGKNIELLDTKRNQLKKLQNELNNLSTVKGVDVTLDIISKRATLKDQIKELTDKIKDIENNSSEINYYSRVHDVLSKYYNIVGKSDHVYVHDDKEKTEASAQLSNLTQLNKKQRKTRRPTKKRIKTLIQDNSKDILCFFGSNDNPKTSESPQNDGNTPGNRATLFDKYMKLVDNGYNAKNKLQNKNLKYCHKCNCERTLIHSDGMYVCRNCGEAENIVIESEIPNYKDSSMEKPSYPYKRMNHLVEWLNQFQAKESTDIPTDVYNSILLEVKRMRVKNLNSLDMMKMKNILKKLKLHQYYEHIPHIISKITGKPPPTLTRDTEDKIKTMFRDIQEPFSKHCPKDRTNFLSYSYVLHKFFQILELPEFVQYFPLLKSREKLRLQDKLWRKICVELEWPFYPSI